MLFIPTFNMNTKLKKKNKKSGGNGCKDDYRHKHLIFTVHCVSPLITKLQLCLETLLNFQSSQMVNYSIRAGGQHLLPKALECPYIQEILPFSGKAFSFTASANAKSLGDVIITRILDEFGIFIQCLR